ncbi:MAG: DUF2863 family protein [Burkholderiaceae bacterium]
MNKKKSPSASKSGTSAAEPDELLASRLVNLAIDLREADVYAKLPDALQKAQAELHRGIRKCLQQKRDMALDEALERSFEEDALAYRVLRSQIEEMSGTIVLHRTDGQKSGPEIEVNAFAVPFFVHTQGGLKSEQCFQDEDAFEKLRESFREGGLESRKANVVLVAHAYHLDEMEKIGFCHLNAMVLEATDAMTKKKAPAADAIARSLSGWPPSDFAPEDSVMELRFLLGFALKTMDDPFYKVPEKEAAADRYFEQRTERFRKWSQDVTPVLKRCLVTDGREAQIDFLYQDLFHGATNAAVRELEMLRVLSEIQRILEENGTSPEAASATIGPMETEDDDVLRISIAAKESQAEIGSAEKALERSETVESAVADIADALDSIGVRDIRVTRRFDAEGRPTTVRPYSS